MTKKQKTELEALRKVQRVRLAHRNRSAGHDWECEVIKILHERGLYPPESVVSCRSNSKHLDDSGIDLMHLEEATHGKMRDSIQCKDQVKPPPFPMLLSYIAKALRPGGVIFWKQRQKAGETGKFMERGRYAMTTMERYLELMACEKFVNWAKQVGHYNGPPEMDAIFGGTIHDRIKELGL